MSDLGGNIGLQGLLGLILLAILLFVGGLLMRRRGGLVSKPAQLAWTVACLAPFAVGIVLYLWAVPEKRPEAGSNPGMNANQLRTSREIRDGQ